MELDADELEREVALITENPSFGPGGDRSVEDLEETVFEKYRDAYSDPEQADRRAEEALDDFRASFDEEGPVSYVDVTSRLYLDKGRDTDPDELFPQREYQDRTTV